MSTELLTNEALVAQRLGVSRDELRALRKKEKGAGLREGAHWSRGENKAIEYTQAGIAEAMRILADAAPTQDELEGIAAAPQRAVLHIARLVTNRRLVLAVADPADVRNPKAALLRVQVKNSKKMRPGMVLDRCRHISADLYAFEGRKARKPTTLAPTPGPSQQPEQ